MNNFQTKLDKENLTKLYFENMREKIVKLFPKLTVMTAGLGDIIRLLVDSICDY